MNTDSINCTNFMELLLVLVKVDYNFKNFYYSELGDYILKCKQSLKFPELLSSYTFTGNRDPRYYTEIINSIEDAQKIGLIRSVDAEYVYINDEYSVIEILKNNLTWVDQMRGFIKGYLVYVNDIDRYIDELNNCLAYYNSILEVPYETSMGR